jgi:hypothetical protein
MPTAIAWKLYVVVGRCSELRRLEEIILTSFVHCNVYSGVMMPPAVVPHIGHLVTGLSKAAGGRQQTTLTPKLLSKDELFPLLRCLSLVPGSTWHAWGPCPWCPYSTFCTLRLWT